MIVRVAITVPESGRSIPSALNSAPIAGANPIPASKPTIEATSPMTNASRTTEVTIWRRLAPSVRSIANSRVRWATVIEKVLKIRNAATNSATPAKISSAVFRKPMNSPTSSRWDWTFSAPVSTSTESGSAAVRLAASRSGVVPGDGGDGDLVELALLAGDPLRLGQGEHGDRRAAERVDVAEGRDPDQRVLLGRLLAGDLDRVADREALVVGRRLVDHDLVVGLRRRALDVGERVEALAARSRSRGSARRCRRAARRRRR